MPFPESVKFEARRKAAFRCCICHKAFVEVHHILPKEYGGPDTLDNAAPLCASCHDLFGGNPEKRKQIRQMRDAWWQMMAERERTLATTHDLSAISIIEEDPAAINRLTSKTVALYHCVFAQEGFEETANHLVWMVSTAQKECPCQRRELFLEIEGHIDVDGLHDWDMFEIQASFIIGFLLRYLSVAYIPIIKGALENPRLQRNDVPDKVFISSEDGNLNIKDIVAETGATTLKITDNKRFLRACTEMQ